MPTANVTKLQRITNFRALVDYLRDELDWPIEVDDADELTFEYEPAELDIDPVHAVKIKTIKQIRPLVDGQPWGVFFIEFESKRLPVVVLRRILHNFVARQRRNNPHRPVWKLDDLLFISVQGETANRSIAFAHFRQGPDRLAELRTFSWDSRETHFHYLEKFNLEALRWPPRDKLNPIVWRELWRRAFPVEHRYVIQHSQELAREMAHQAKRVRELVKEVYRLERQDGPLHQLYKSFKDILLHDLTAETFADMVAQTVAYGLFSAATQSIEELSYDHLVNLIPATNPFLKELLAELTRTGRIDLAELGVDRLVELLRQTNMNAILRDFGRQSGYGREDPVIHFYELFLNEYDRNQRVQRGVFYTPDPVVSYIVRSVDYLLKTEFGLKDGLADTTINPETGEPWVQILDPATGTGTFLAHVIDRIEQTIKAKPGADWNHYVTKYLLPRLHGFELLMAPYAVAHMKLGLKLKQTGYNFAGDERLRIYLSNALDEPIERHETLALTGFLSKESNSAAYIKLRSPITVVMGNPPYSVSSVNSGDWIVNLLEDYKRTVRTEETQIQAISNDYVKFIRFTHWRIEKTRKGIIGIITSNGYLRGPLFRDMRKALLDSFSKIYILNLHGSTRWNEKTPDGREDKNVFDIQQGVAIILLICDETQNSNKAEVLYTDLWGTREEKYADLLSHDVAKTNWISIKPNAPLYIFSPGDETGKEEYNAGWLIPEIFGTGNPKLDQNHRWGTGFATRHDEFAIAMSPSEVIEKVEYAADLTLTWEQLNQRYRLCTTAHWVPEVSRRRLAQTKVADYIRKIHYRPFSFQYTVYLRDVVLEPRTEVMRHLSDPAKLPNLALVTARVINGEIPQHEFVSRYPVEKIFLSAKTSNNAFVFPLYIYNTPEDTKGTLFSTEENSRKPNLSPHFIQEINIRLGLNFIKDGLGNLTSTLGPEDVFHYAYAIFYSPFYRSLYAEFLKDNFPRLPLTRDVDLFRALCQLGADLVALHLLEDDYRAASWLQQGQPSPLQSPVTTFVKRATGTTVGAVNKNNAYDQGKIYLDTSNRARSSYFEGVPEEVWNFHIGGYQVCHKWLYDRRGSGGEPGRTLTEEDIAHYQRIVVALNETIRLMSEIDEIIEAHGGWPLVGSVGEA